MRVIAILFIKINHIEILMAEGDNMAFYIDYLEYI